MPKTDKLNYTDYEVFEFIVAAAHFGKELRRYGLLGELQARAEKLERNKWTVYSFSPVSNIDYPWEINHLIQFPGEEQSFSETILYPLATDDHVASWTHAENKPTFIDCTMNPFGCFFLYHCTITPGIEESAHSEELAKAFKLDYKLFSAAVWKAAKDFAEVSPRSSRPTETIDTGQTGQPIGDSHTATRNASQESAEPSANAVEDWIRPFTEEPPDNWYKESHLEGTRRRLSLACFANTDKPDARRLEKAVKRGSIWVRALSKNYLQAFWTTKELFDLAKKRLEDAERKVNTRAKRQRTNTKRT